jgi:mRNA interferase RelE/StbE
VYKLEVSPAADRDLFKLANHIQRLDFERLKAAISSLVVEPRPPGVRKIKGAEKVFRIRVGSFCVVYEVYDNEKLLLILQVIRRTESTYGL